MLPSVYDYGEFDTFLSPLLIKNNFYIYIDNEFTRVIRDDEFAPLPLTGTLSVQWHDNDHQMTPNLSFPNFEPFMEEKHILSWGSFEQGLIPNMGTFPVRILLYRGKVDNGEPFFQKAFVDSREDETMNAGYYLLGNISLIEAHSRLDLYQWECVHVDTNFGGNLVGNSVA